MSNPLAEELAAELASVLEEAAPRLAALDEAGAARRPRPGKWSPKEILGHLIDSAANNHPRFVRAQLEDHLEFDGYAQDDWVNAQRYAQADWTELIVLWRAYNRHLARVISAIPRETLVHERTRHSLHHSAWR